MSTDGTMAKIMYLLSTCPVFSDKMFEKLLRSYEKIIATKHYYELWINLRKNDKFELKNVRNKFLDFSGSYGDYDGWLDELDMEILNLDSNLSPTQIQDVYNRYKALTGNLSNNDKRHLLILPTLINKYVDSQYKYLFFPVILDYGMNTGIVHQCGLLIDIKKKIIMFYEPYGIYAKDGSSYSEVIKTYFKIFEVFDFTFSTYHDAYGSTRGIQKIILDKNNEHVDIFATKYTEIVEEVAEYPDLYNNLINISHDEKSHDKTLPVLNLIGRFNKFSNKYGADPKYNEIWIKAFTLYCQYNSKTCVTITLVEMDYFFQTILNEEKIDLLGYYKKYDIVYPNKTLVQDFMILIKKWKN